MKLILNNKAVLDEATVTKHDCYGNLGNGGTVRLLWALLEPW